MRDRARRLSQLLPLHQIHRLHQQARHISLLSDYVQFKRPRLGVLVSGLRIGFRKRHPKLVADLGYRRDHSRAVMFSETCPWTMDYASIPSQRTFRFTGSRGNVLEITPTIWYLKSFGQVDNRTSSADSPFHDFSSGPGCTSVGLWK
jgi:hypothetical protein